MTEKVKMTFTEEEFEEMISLIMGNLTGYSITKIKENARKHGYILPDPVEEAEERYNAYRACDSQLLTGEKIAIMEKSLIKQHEAIQHMKPYYEKHKGEKI